MSPELTPNPLPCGCVAKYSDGMISPPIYVELCQIHKATPKLLAACRAFLIRYENPVVDASFVFGDVKEKIDAAIAAVTPEN
jgi:hypothetical protein